MAGHLKRDSMYGGIRTFNGTPSNHLCQVQFRRPLLDSILETGHAASNPPQAALEATTLCAGHRPGFSSSNASLMIGRSRLVHTSYPFAFRCSLSLRNNSAFGLPSLSSNGVAESK
jgi:hypothetical protein